MKSKSADKIKMPSIDELLGVSGEESATDIEISRIHSFVNHPFKVLDDDKMDDLVESIKQNGVLTPVLVRPDKNNSYEMISGHRRMHAAIKAGLETIPAIVRDMEDDEAIVIMVDANIQAEDLKIARPRLERIEADVLNNFKVLGAQAHSLNGCERLEIMYHIFN